MIVDDESEVILQLKQSKKIKRLRKNHQRLVKHQNDITTMQEKVMDQELAIITLIEARLKFYEKNSLILQWKEEVSQHHITQYISNIKSESETFDESYINIQQSVPYNEVENFIQ